MTEQALRNKILDHLKSERYQPQRPRRLAREMELQSEAEYGDFRQALRALMREGRVVQGARGALVLPTQMTRKDELIGTYRQNRRGFGFVVPTDPTSHEDLYVAAADNGGAITGDVVRAKIISRGHRDGKAMHSGQIVEIITRTNKRFVGTLQKHGAVWTVMPDGNTLTEPILTPDAASRHIRPGTKVVIDLTVYSDEGQQPQGVITEVLGASGEKDVDLKSVIVQFNLPEKFPDAVLNEARHAVDSFKPDAQRAHRLDLTEEVICTIDPDDAKDYDDAISLRQVEGGYWELGVHIADVSSFVPAGSALDEEARKRGNSSYFPGFVIPMLPEILSNGVCSLQEGVPRLCKSAFITYDDEAKPIRAEFANSIIRSANRLRYREAQALIDREQQIPHPDGPRRREDYPEEVLELLDQMNTLARRLQRRRLQQGQLVLDLPEVELVLDEDGKVVDAVPEDQSFTHTLIEMFMVEANEAVARLLDSLDVPFLRRIHPEPEPEAAFRLRSFVQAAGHRIPKHLDRHALQSLLTSVRGKPESFAINMAVLKSLTRAEYSPQVIGHYALASEHYCHFTSPIRRYADLTIHRLLDAYFAAGGQQRQSIRGKPARTKRRKGRIELEGIPSEEELIETGRHISFTERRAEDAERELRQVKILTLLKDHVGDEFPGVVSGVTNFGLFVQIQSYLIDGLIRYEHLLDDWWDVDEKSGSVRGERSGIRIRLGDPVKVTVVKVDLARRELDLALTDVLARKKTKQKDVERQPKSLATAKQKKQAKGRRRERYASRRRRH